MTTRRKIGEGIGWLIWALTWVFVGVMAGVMVTVTKIELEYRESPTVEEQHESIMLDHEWLYCPYCGEKLESEVAE